ncbi:MAG: hypothetical protein COB35_13525 [Gammaproteobacteria bacterium]|nr:MAG: hypothetical protein COB35_13525 [Gammaproteobacteria bacterium]
MQTVKRSYLFIILAIIFVVAGCGGSNSSSPTPTNPPPAPPSSQIPNTVAITPITALTPKPLPPAGALPTQAILRHVHRNTVKGVLSPNGNYIDSNNAKVEKRGLLGLYFEVDRQADNRYVIDLDDNGLAYFRVTNTKPNGSVRVHNFYGVIPGFYMSFDTTDVEFIVPENPLTACRKNNIRLIDIPNISANSRILINGHLVNNAIIENNKAYLENVELCPLDDQNHYLAMVVVENSASDIQYGFNFYQTLEENSFLEVKVDQSAELVAWTSDFELGNVYDLYAIQYGWQKYLHLYASAEAGNFSGTYPKFSALNLSSYRFMSDTTDLSSGIDINTRELSSDSQQVNFAINNIKLDDLSLTPLDLSWKNIGANRPKVIAGLIFNTSLTQTYAFMSMDEGVLNGEKFTFPLDDLPLLLDSTLVATTGAAGINDENQYISQAALYSGFLFWPNEQAINNDNSDVFITANATALLKVILDSKIIP